MYENYILLVVIFAKCTVNAQYFSSKHSLHSNAQSGAQSVLCVPVPDHMLCYPFHVIGYWCEYKPIPPKLAIQNAV